MDSEEVDVSKFIFMGSELFGLGPLLKWDFNVRPGTMDDWIVAETIINDIYRVREIPSVLGYTPQTIVDLGGHIGGFSALAMKAFAGVSLYTYEAHLQNYIVLQSNLITDEGKVRYGRDYANPPSITLNNNIVCGDEPPTSFLTDSTPKETTAGLRMNTGGGKVVYGEEKTSITTPHTTLEQIIDDNRLDKIDFLKMDIEGSEFQVLEHAKKTGALEKVKYLACELHVNPKRGRNFDTFMGYLDNFSEIEVVHDKKKNHRMVFAKQ